MGLKLSFMKYLQVPPYHPGTDGNTQAGNIFEWSEGVYLYIWKKETAQMCDKKWGLGSIGWFCGGWRRGEDAQVDRIAPSLQAIRQEDASHSDTDTQSAVGKAICGAATTNWVGNAVLLGNNPGILCPVEPWRTLPLQLNVIGFVKKVSKLKVFSKEKLWAGQGIRWDKEKLYVTIRGNSSSTPRHKKHYWRRLNWKLFQFWILGYRLTFMFAPCCLHRLCRLSVELFDQVMRREWFPSQYLGSRPL